MQITIENLRTLLGWCAVINMAIMLGWFLAVVFAHNFMLRMHTRWFRISEERFDEIHYTLMGHYKLAVILFILVPYLVLKLVDFS
ncbi:MAG: hypothetical protein VCA40_04080 [Roseibacillus sp.]|nr:hypothetical protein [Roseibacillus sp.]MEE2622635.1 hypothetical protein [Verrucomicrobiota bacterium]|tara:strand:- start:15 stop:269 length:255 start_codon:yes stop_codon:yes gene_type:complete